MDDCPFCDVVLRGRIIESNNTAQVFFSNPRLTAGHLLVAPVRHVEEPWNLNASEVSDIFYLVHKYQKLLAETIGDGCDVKQNFRPFLEQSRLKVDHVHFHLVPRTFEDEIYQKAQRFESEIFQELTDEEKASVLELIGVK